MHQLSPPPFVLKLAATLNILHSMEVRSIFRNTFLGAPSPKLHVLDCGKSTVVVRFLLYHVGSDFESQRRFKNDRWTWWKIVCGLGLWDHFFESKMAKLVVKVDSLHSDPLIPL